jgi:outer membrane autotransporter protein
VTNSGQLSPVGGGVAGRFTINGNYVQTASGVLNIDIGGYTPGDEYDQLVISGSASLNGTLNVFLINFTPLTNDTFQILTCGMPLSGRFMNENVGARFRPPVYNTMDVTLVAN